MFAFLSLIKKKTSTLLFKVCVYMSTVHIFVFFYFIMHSILNVFIYLDIESKPFNSLRPVWGLSQVLQLVTFNDHKNGYIFGGDQCEFGVDVIVAPPPTQWETISFDAELTNPN